ncbi:ribosomal RNA small subunit methyltransferase h [Plakobranchus ocellatus]|uniref:12S rRNA N(4)-cytidine methyltransferase METTL15 n=1 Tax=Plakobranchus ocellatus TaxID=259542 RepID=A0AAV4BIK5_9GAST|nr:ribosomal RNA small subunit methyltransferase h [Plakobranchus ocellatus]
MLRKFSTRKLKTTQTTVSSRPGECKNCCNIHVSSQMSDPVADKFLSSILKTRLILRKFSTVAQQEAKSNAMQNSKSLSTKADEDMLNHVPVMAQEILSLLQPKNGQVIVDMTFGAGGHAEKILKAAPDITYFASDRDPVAFRKALAMASSVGSGQIIPLLSRFSEVPAHLQHHGITLGSVDAFLFDLGASSMQFDSAQRGFSLSKDGPLDMRMDGERFPDSPTAADVVNNLDPADLANILKKYGEEKKARQIAHAIVDARYAFGNFTRTKQLAEVLSSVFESGAFRQDKLHRQAHVATKTFQALRIFVNDELNELHAGLLVAARYLRPGSSVCAALAFHSLEDRIIKRHFHGLDMDCAGNQTVRDHFRNASLSFNVGEIQKQILQGKAWQPLSKKVACPTEVECLVNPRARSAKLRAAVRAAGEKDLRDKLL